MLRNKNMSPEFTICFDGWRLAIDNMPVYCDVGIQRRQSQESHLVHSGVNWLHGEVEQCQFPRKLEVASNKVTRKRCKYIIFKQSLENNKPFVFLDMKITRLLDIQMHEGITLQRTILLMIDCIRRVDELPMNFNSKN